MKRTLWFGVAISSVLMISSSNATRAADLAVKTPAPPTAPWSWTGFYVGLQGGGAMGTDADQVTALQLCGTGGSCTSPLGPVGFSQSSFGISWPRSHVGGERLLVFLDDALAAVRLDDLAMAH
jgi:hypothetical protein